MIRDNHQPNRIKKIQLNHNICQIDMLIDCDVFSH